MRINPGAPWLIAADRGGTFTDCWATDPQGRRHRAKLLSSGHLRLAVAIATPYQLALATAAEYPQNFFRGWTAALYMPGAAALENLPLEEGRHFVDTGGQNVRSPQQLPPSMPSNWLALVEHSSTTLLTFSTPVPACIPPGTFLELSTGEAAPVVGARLLTGTRLHDAFPPHRYRLATTLATNALLEQQSATVAFFVTQGFRDLLTIGDQRRADLFALHHQRDRPLHHHTVEVPERLRADGSVLLPLDAAALSSQVAGLVRAGVRSAAVALAHSDLNPSHERAVREILLTAGFTTISLSSDLSAQIKLLPRAQTAVLDAALAPVMQDFVERVRTALGPACQEFHCLTSAGGLAAPDVFHAKDSLLSGPAGGIAGCAAAARRAGIAKILTLDMGGTSTDVARWEGEFLYQFEQRHGSSIILGPSLRIETVAAGGGSVCAVNAGSLTVGPRSAGANPGPACYGRGGPLTLTDVNLLLGRIDPAKASIPLQRAPAQLAFNALKKDMQVAGLAIPENDTALLRGLLQIAIGRIAEAVRSISVRDGCDPAAYTLLAFGGAGPQHACAIAEELGITQILVPAEAGILSAAGAAAAAHERFGSRQLLQPLGNSTWLNSILTDLETETLVALAHPRGVIRQRLADLRLQGQDTALTLAFDHPGQLQAAFNSQFQQLYGYPPPGTRAIEVVSLRVIAAPPESVPPPETFPDNPDIPAPVVAQVIQDAFSTLILEPNWSATQGTAGSWLLKHIPASCASASPDFAASHGSPATIELFRCRFQGLVDGMGELLRRTSVSTNVKERLDYSCALLDANGSLLVNAPHIPVHLGALGECVRRTTALLTPGPGDVLVTNDPAFGGSHLPDVTVICPVFAPSGELLAYTANRAHHAEIGGITPGSMPASAKNLAGEGVVIRPTWLVKNNVSQEGAIAHLLTNPPHPTRALPDNLADLRAQAAAAHHGATALLSLCRTHGEASVRVYLSSLTQQAEAAMARTLAASPLTHASAVSALDDGTPLQVALTKNDDRLTIDFTGSGAVHPGNRNATPAVVRSAVLYVLRLWTGEPIPLNEGFLANVEIIIPPGFLNPPFADDPIFSPAVVGGNVETSQRVVEVLIAALGLQAASQGTMNNVIFGDASFGHYETLCGGTGAGPGYPGTDAIHSHMTNTAITDIEVLERRYPVRIESFSIRPGSGGGGEYPGGHGAVRCYHFLAPLTLSLLTEHRLTPPPGHAGGHPGACGEQFLILPDGARQDLPGTVTLAVNPGTTLHIHTPGGGGWG